MRAPISCTVIVSSCIVAASCPASAIAAAPDAAEFSYRYFKESRPLQLDAGRIAVLQLAETRPEVVAELAALSVDRAGITANAIAGWSFVPTPAALRNSAGVSELMGRLSAVKAGFVSPVFVGLDGGPVFVTPTILVRFREGVDERRAAALVESSCPGATSAERWASMRNGLRVTMGAANGTDVLAAANRLAQLAETIFAEPDMVFTGRGDLIPNDPLFADLWGIHNTGQSGGTPDVDMDGVEAWDFSTGDPSILVGIIDVGVQQDHPDINQVPGADFTGQASTGGPINACDNHGTAVAGCVSARINNGVGITGLAPSCRTMSLRTFISNTPCDGSWSAPGSWTVDALAYAETHGVRVSNNSNYYGFQSSAIANKYADTRANGMVHFASAGNDASSTITYPSSLSSVNAVAAITRNGPLAGFSNFGTGLDFAAPGQTIRSTDRTGANGYAGGDYALVDGTSFASPYTAAAAALVLSVQPSLTAAAVEDLLKTTASDFGAIGYDLQFGWGVPNAWAAVQAASDCNHNGLTDVDEIAANSSLDCQPDGRLDSCEVAVADCNGNLHPDDCDLVDLAAAVVGPSDQAVCVNGSTSFSVQGPPGAAYQWYLDETPLADDERLTGAHSSTLGIAGVTPADAGAYHCVVSAGCISTPSAAANLLLAADTLTVTQEPVAQVTICASSGQSAAFDFHVDNENGVGFQWFKDGSPLSEDGHFQGVGRSRLLVAGATPADTGTYTCAAFNACGGAAQSDPARGNLVIVGSAIESQPQDTCAAVGGTARFAALAISSPGTQFFWFRNGDLLSNGVDPAGMVVSGASSTRLKLTQVPASYHGSDIQLVSFLSSPTCVGQSAIAKLNVGGCGPCPFKGDLDGDLDVDLRDMAAFAACFGQSSVSGGACACADVATSNVIDIEDWSVEASLFTGP